MNTAYARFEELRCAERMMRAMTGVGSLEVPRAVGVVNANALYISRQPICQEGIGKNRGLTLMRRGRKFD
jgi:hypothetical protein